MGAMLREMMKPDGLRVWWRILDASGAVVQEGTAVQRFDGNETFLTDLPAVAGGQTLEVGPMERVPT
jgi:hypothetical protein